MMHANFRNHRGWTLVETLITVTIIAVLAAIAVPLLSSQRERGYRERAAVKLRSLGVAMTTYSSDHGGLLPWEDASGTDDWQAIVNPENREVWYNALPALIGSDSAATISRNPKLFYEDSYPLALPGAPYPSGDKKLGTPYFAIAMNSRLQRKDDSGIKKQGNMAQIQNPAKTVIFLERGMPGDKQTSPGQRGFDASPKANARAFVARYNGRGLLVFADGHIGHFAVSELISTSGQINFPQTKAVWTNDPELDPN